MIRRLVLLTSLVAGFATGPAAADAPLTLATPDSAATPRPGVLSRAGRMTANFAWDTWYVVSSPARLDQSGWLKTLAFAAPGAVLFAYDEDITRAFHRAEGNPLYDAVIDVGFALEGLGYPGRTFPYYIGGTLIGAAFHIEPVQRAGLDILESQLISGGVRNVVQILVGRRRPHEGQGAYVFEFNGGTSFPSGHTSSAFQLATILSHHVDRAPVTALLYGAAVAVAFERVDSDSHWSSDVYFSAIEGTLVAQTVVRRNDERRSAGPRYSLVPGPRGIALRVSF